MLHCIKLFLKKYNEEYFHFISMGIEYEMPESLDDYDDFGFAYPIWSMLDPSRPEFKLPCNAMDRFVTSHAGFEYKARDEPSVQEDKGPIKVIGDLIVYGESKLVWQKTSEVVSQKTPWQCSESEKSKCHPGGPCPDPELKPDCSKLFDGFLSSEFFKSSKDASVSIDGWMIMKLDDAFRNVIEDEAAGELTLKTEFSALYMALSKAFWENDVVREWVVTLLKSSLTHKVCQQEENEDLEFVMSLCHLCSEEVVGWPITGEPCVPTDALQSHLILRHNEQLNATLCPGLDGELISNRKDNVTCKSVSFLPFYKFYKESCDKVAASDTLQTIALANDFDELFRTFNNLIGTPYLESSLNCMQFDEEELRLLRSNHFSHCFLFFMRQAIGIIASDECWDWEDTSDAQVSLPTVKRRKAVEEDE